MTRNFLTRCAICTVATFSLCALASCQGRTDKNVTPNGETVEVQFDTDSIQSF